MINEFDSKAAGWDLNPMHMERSKAVAKQIIERIPLEPWMKALEFGAGTGLTSFLLFDHLGEITMMDNSLEMIKIMKNKIKTAKAGNLKALFFDLEKNSWSEGKFDLILTQMTLHHVSDIKDIIQKFCLMLNPGGYIAVADLYSEDGSFHGDDFTGHKGFDVEYLSKLLRKKDFTNISHEKCFVINKKLSDDETKEFDVFLLTARCPNLP